MKENFYFKLMTTEIETENNTEIKLREENQETTDVDKLKSGEFILSALQVLLLNKRMPIGYKLELEEVYLKTGFDISSKQNNSKLVGKKRRNGEEKSKKWKKKKYSDMSGSDFSTSNQVQKRSAREKKPNKKEDLGYVEYKVKCKDPKLIEVSKRCDKVMSSLRTHLDFEVILKLTASSTAFMEIDKKVKTYQYSSIYSFGMEIRTLFTNLFSICVEDRNSYNKGMVLNKYFEDIYRDISEPQVENKEIEQLNKKIQKIESQIQDKRPSSITNTFGNKQQSRVQVPQNEKPMTMNEKNILSNNIRSLSTEQMKGIINLLCDQYPLEKNSKYFEFDIEKLSTKKLRELEKYVKKCITKNKKGGKSEKVYFYFSLIQIHLDRQMESKMKNLKKLKQ